MTPQTRRVLASFVVIVGFTTMLVGTSKAPVDGEGDTEAVAETSVEAATLPSTDAWEQVTHEDLGIRFKIPPGTRAPTENSGNDTQYSGRFFNVFFGELMVNFAQGTVTSEGVESGSPALVAAGKARIEADGETFRGVVFDAPDAFVADREEGKPVGKYCEVIACSKAIEGRPLCVNATAEVDGSEIVDQKTYLEAPVHKLTREQCLAVAAIARSIEPIEPTEPAEPAEDAE